LLVVSPLNGPTTLPTPIEWKSAFVGVGRLLHFV
jgi:hypothetical protein